MATARNVFPEAEAVLNTVTFTYINNVLSVTKPSVMMAATDQIVFGNSPSSSAAIQLVFAANPPGVANPPGLPLFNNVQLSPGQGTGNLTPLNSVGSVNYTVLVAGSQVGDTYAVQVGAGPLYVTVNGDVCTPKTTVVPINGSIEFYSIDNANHGIIWNAANGNPFPGLSNVYPLSNPLTRAYTETFPAGGYGYTMGPGAAAVGGGGTVKIKQTT